jgi:hypothetical protein
VVFNATFNNISVISWWSVLLLEETGVVGENHRLAVVQTAVLNGIVDHHFSTSLVCGTVDHKISTVL